VRCYLKYGALISPLGTTIEEHAHALLSNDSGIKQVEDSGFNNENWFLGKMNELSGDYDALLEKALGSLKSIWDAETLKSPRTGVFVSTTKANMNLLPGDTFESTRTLIKKQLHQEVDPVIISNACISGVVAINVAADYLKAGKFDRAIIIGIDVLSDFIIYGFQSLFALGNEVCKPFDAERKGISLGEACGIILMTNEREEDVFAEYIAGASSNDANHISGPSRTGEGLVRAVSKTLERAGMDKTEIDFVSAHGTATIYNDEMEAIAFNRLGLEQTPLNSLKGYFGHTLGAAGIIELLSCMISMEKNTLIKSLGYQQCGTTQTLAIVEENREKELTTILKTASGFGGGNASLILKKVQ